jgi:hypothetical protein
MRLIAFLDLKGSARRAPKIGIRNIEYVDGLEAARRRGRDAIFSARCRGKTRPVLKRDQVIKINFKKK